VTPGLRALRTENGRVVTVPMAFDAAGQVERTDGGAKVSVPRPRRRPTRREGEATEPAPDATPG
jgi:hypothetical protein